MFLFCGDSQKEYEFLEIMRMDNGLWTEKFSDEPIAGKVYRYYGEVEPLKKVYLGNIRNGKEEGKWVYYLNSTGQKKYEQNYKDGNKDGLWITWYENGQKKKEGTFKDGEQISKKEWNEDGSIME